MNLWKDIENAPENKEVLVYREDMGVTVGIYTTLNSLLKDFEIDKSAYTRDELISPDWFIQGMPGYHRAEGDEAPTHWQDLPEQPTNHRVETELIKHAAVKALGGLIFIGKQHAECFGKIRSVGMKFNKNATDASRGQGFMTNKGRYVDRYEAADIALESGQIDKETKMLFSESLWCPDFGGKWDYCEIDGYRER